MTEVKSPKTLWTKKLKKMQKSRAKTKKRNNEIEGNRTMNQTANKHIEPCCCCVAVNTEVKRLHNKCHKKESRQSFFKISESRAAIKYFYFKNVR